MHKIVIIFWIFPFLPNVSWAENTIGNTFTVNISQQSYLTINGSTNINSFSCHFNTDNLADTFNIRVEEKEGCLNFTNYKLALPVKSFDCGNRQMNNDLKELLKCDTFPEIIWKILCVDISSFKNNVENKQQTVYLKAEVNIAGVQKDYWFPVQMKKVNNEILISGQMPLNILDFNLSPPRKVFGLVKVLPAVEIDFSIDALIVEK